MSTIGEPRRSYVDLVHALPHPTHKQVVAFVHHISEAENWLKSLPLEEGPPLYVYLDPNAGARLSHDCATGEYSVENLTPDSKLLYDGELPSADYRDRFGYLTYYIDLGLAVAAGDEEWRQRAALPEPGIIHQGLFVPFPGPLRAFACRPTAFLHGSFRGVRSEGSMRRFRYAIEKLARQDNVPREHPFIQRLEAWIEQCHQEDQAGFRRWLHAAHAEDPEQLDANTRWLRYIAWRDDDECLRLHDCQDEAFKETGIPDEVATRHATIMQRLRESTHALLESLHAMMAS